jgi:hypothetical protein
MTQTVALSERAIALIRRRLSGDREVTHENLEAYRELARAGIMVAGHSFTGGRESVFKFTDDGWAFANATWPGESAAPRT